MTGPARSPLLDRTVLGGLRQMFDPGHLLWWGVGVLVVAFGGGLGLGLGLVPTVTAEVMFIILLVALMAYLALVIGVVRRATGNTAGPLTVAQWGLAAAAFVVPLLLPVIALRPRRAA